MLKSETVNRKFTWSQNIFDYEVETDNGFVDIVAIHQTIPYLKFIIKTKNKILECADDHILFNNNMDEVFAKELNVGDLILTKDGVEEIKEIINTGVYEEMYDLELSDNSNHRYYTNDILSHNTLVAKKLAKEMFGTEEAIIRFDMSEYFDKTAVNKLIGSNPGYVGYEDGGLLTEAVKNKKYCVLLLDEIEKADPEVYNIFLQVLDEGFLTDNSGMRVDFKNVIVLFTSNVGTKAANDFGKGIGFNTDADENSKKILLKELKKKFPAEFINRLTNVIYFNSLTDENLKDIIKLEIKKFENRLNEIGYNVEYDENVIDYILNIVKDEKEYGARPIARAIQDEIEDKITDLLLENEYENGYIFKITYPYTIDINNVGKIGDNTIVKTKPVYDSLKVS